MDYLYQMWKKKIDRDFFSILTLVCLFHSVAAWLLMKAAACGLQQLHILIGAFVVPTVE